MTPRPYVPIPDVAATQPLEAKVVLRAGEPGGRAVERNVTLPILPKGGLIGVKKDFASLGDGDIGEFRCHRGRLHGAATGRAAKASRGRSTADRQDYQWYKQDGHWDFEEVKSSRRVAEGTIDLTADAAARSPRPSSSATIVSTSRAPIRTDAADQRRRSASAGPARRRRERPTFSKSRSTRQDYKPGDAMKLKIASRFAGTATIAILNDQLEYSALIDVKKGDNVASVPVGANWGAGAYAVVVRASPARSGRAAQSRPGARARLVQRRRRKPQAQHRHRRAGEDCARVSISACRSRSPASSRAKRPM